MIHYHGTPIGGTRDEIARFLCGRHALVPFPRPDDIGAVSEFCQSFCLDNGAYSVWKRGECLDVDGYIRWVDDWHRHPGFDWALIPDVIDGSECENDQLVRQWPRHLPGVPVFHMHESLDRARRLAEEWPIVALGSSGQWSHPNTNPWWKRMGQIMDSICDEGKPRCRLHGLRMMNPAVFSLLPLTSADSTNATQNASSTSAFGRYRPATVSQRLSVIADRVESHNSSPVWQGIPQLEMAL